MTDWPSQPDQSSAAAVQRWHAPSVLANRLVPAEGWGKPFLAYNVFVLADPPGAAALAAVQDQIALMEPCLLRLPETALHITAAFLLPGSAEFGRPKDELWHQHGALWLAQLAELAAGTPAFTLSFGRLLVTDAAIVAVADEPNELSALRRRLLTSMDVPGSSHGYDLVHTTLFRYSGPLRDPAALLEWAASAEVHADISVGELVVAREHTFPFLGYGVLRRLALGVTSLRSGPKEARAMELITSPDKVYFAERGETKGDLAEHYVRVAEPLMRVMGGRPVLLQRFPEGASGPSFFQKRVPKNKPDWLQTTVVSTPNGTTSEALVAANLDHVLWAVNLGCLGFHVWPYLADDPGHTDELRIDLDPTPGTDFSHIRLAARELHALLEECGVTGYPKTTGNRGLHVYVRLEPRWDSYQVRSAAVAIARELERRHPDLITAAWWKEERGRRIFVDFNQNAPHKTVFGAWSVRARPGAQVSTPVTWPEIDSIHPDQFTIASLPARLDSVGDPWLGMNEVPQSLEPFLQMQARDLDNGIPDAPWPPVYPKQPGEPPRVAPSRAKKQ